MYARSGESHSFSGEPRPRPGITHGNRIARIDPGLVLGAGLLVFALASATFAVETSAPVGHGKDVLLTADDLRAELNSAPPDALARLVDDPLRVSTLVSSLLGLRVLAAEAEREGLLTDPVLLHRIQRAKEQIVAEALRERKLAAIKEPDFGPLAEEKYRANPTDYKIAEQVQARHILIKVADGADQAVARAQLESLAAQIRGGEDFAKLAREFSEDKSTAEKGGDLGYFGRGRMLKPFEEAAFALKTPGQMSPVTATRFGLHLIQLVDRKPESVRPFSEVRESIISKLRADYRRDYMAAWERQLIESADIQVDAKVVDEVLQTLRARPQPGAASGR